MKKVNRREFCKTAGAGIAGILACQTAPFFVRRVEAATKTVRVMTAENVTGNWDPFGHTNLAQDNTDAQIFSNLAATYMVPGTDPMTLTHIASESITPMSPYVREIKLKKGLKWHDGTDVTAEDIVASAEYASRPGGVSEGKYPIPMKGKVIDKHTCRLSTEDAGKPILAFDLGHYYFHPVKAEDIADGLLSKRPLGFGPYKFVAQEGESTIMEAFDGYALGRPKIDRLIFTYTGDALTRIMALLAGECEMIERLEGEQYDDLQKSGKVATVQTSSIENHFLHFRCQKPPFNDLRVRRAAVYSIDRSVIVDVLGKAGAMNDDMLPEGKVGFNKNASLPEYDPAKAQQLLKEAGFPNGNGLPELELITSVGFYPKTKEYGEVITALLQEQGFPVKMSAHEVAAWNARIYKPSEGHIVDLGWAVGGATPGLHLGYMWNCAKEEGGLVTAWKDKKGAELFNKYSSAETVEELDAVLKNEFMPYVRQQLPSMAIYRHVLLHALAKNLKGVYFQPTGCPKLDEAELV